MSIVSLFFSFFFASLRAGLVTFFLEPREVTLSRISLRPSRLHLCAANQTLSFPHQVNKHARDGS